MLAMLFFGFLIVCAVYLFNKLVLLVTAIINLPRKLMIARARAKRNSRSDAVIPQKVEYVEEVVADEAATNTTATLTLDRDSKICLGQFPNQEEIDWSVYDTPSFVRNPARQHCLSW